MKMVIRILIFVILLVLLAWGIYYMQGNLSFSIGNKVTQKNAFLDYTVDTKFDGDTFRVEMKDMITSTGSGSKQYYRYDIMVETVDKKSAKMIKDQKIQVVAIMNSVMSTFPPEKLSTAPQRDRVKQIMAQKINEHYPEIKIKDLYFTNYVYN
ncbi:MAG: flagellar basal body-associated protein FliL [Deferribacterales bacterium]